MEREWEGGRVVARGADLDALNGGELGIVRTLPQGRTVSFKNALVILTSNIGSRTIASSGTGALGAFMGRGRGGAAEAEAMTAAAKARLRNLVLDEVKQHFRPELLNRCAGLAWRTHATTRPRCCARRTRAAPARFPRAPPHAQV